MHLVVLVDGVRGRLFAGVGLDDRPEKPTRGEQLSKDELWGDDEWRLTEPSVLDDERVRTLGWLFAAGGFWLGLVAAGVSSLSILPLDRGGATAIPEYDTPGVIQRIQRRLFGTHPPTDHRIEPLETLEAEQEKEQHGPFSAPAD